MCEDYFKMAGCLPGQSIAVASDRLPCPVELRLASFAQYDEAQVCE